MPLVIKSREAPQPWRVVRARTNKWLIGPVWVNWVCDQTAYALSRWPFLEVLEYAGSMSVLVAVVFWFAEAGQRRMAAHYQAWQVINTAQGKGGCGGRIEALESLNSDEVPLIGVDLSDAFLQDVDLHKAELRRANFAAADLRRAVFDKADLADANFRSANLRGAFLRDSDVNRASFNDADFTGADLDRADLGGASFMGADLSGVDLADVRNWQKIEGIRWANVHGVLDAPDGFIVWAMNHGAVDMADPDQWLAAVNKADAADTNWRAKP